MANTSKKLSVWETINYYSHAGEASLNTRHPGMKLLKNLANDAKNILDLGCGEGTRLSKISTRGTGIDISLTAIRLAKERHRSYKFLVADLERIPFGENSFDLVYSAFVFEHLSDPEKVIDEAKRVLQRGGNLVIICPNFGAPNRSSPVFKGSRILKLVIGYFRDITYLFLNPKGLNWNRVFPISETGKYETDLDTTIEPYSLSLEKYLNNVGLAVVKNISTWACELENVKRHQKLFRFLGERGIYPFSYWSPHIVILAKKI